MIDRQQCGTSAEPWLSKSAKCDTVIYFAVVFMVTTSVIEF